MSGEMISQPTLGRTMAEAILDQRIKELTGQQPSLAEPLQNLTDQVANWLDHRLTSDKDLKGQVANYLAKSPKIGGLSQDMEQLQAKLGRLALEVSTVSQSRKDSQFRFSTTQIARTLPEARYEAFARLIHALTGVNLPIINANGRIQEAKSKQNDLGSQQDAWQKKLDWLNEGYQPDLPTTLINSYLKVAAETTSSAFAFGLVATPSETRVLLERLGKRVAHNPSEAEVKIYLSEIESEIPANEILAQLASNDNPEEVKQLGKEIWLANQACLIEGWQGLGLHLGLTA